jgi:hypothetical protein
MILEPLGYEALRAKIYTSSLDLPISDFVKCTIAIAIREPIANIIRNLKSPIRHKLYELREEGD